MAIVLDSSGSVSDANWKLMEDFTVDLINDVKIGPNNVRMAILMYAYGFTIISNLDQHNSNSELLAVFNANSRTSGGTATDSAIRAVRLNVFGSTTRDVKKIGKSHVCLDRVIILIILSRLPLSFLKQSYFLIALLCIFMQMHGSLANMQKEFNYVSNTFKPTVY